MAIKAGSFTLLCLAYHINTKGHVIVMYRTKIVAKRFCKSYNFKTKMLTHSEMANVKAYLLLMEGEVGVA